jgi:predicted nucleotidyltransferase
MPNLYNISIKKNNSPKKFSQNEKIAVLYHDLFDYPLSHQDLEKWKSGKQLSISNYQFPIMNKKGYYFLTGREGIIYKRLLKKRISAGKMKIARRASGILLSIPGVKMVGVTGSLAMKNSSDESDVDLFLIIKKGMLWTTRMLSYIVLRLHGLEIRKPNSKQQENMLCLNMWLDEDDLSWARNDRNLYTAHEIAQIVPLVNKNNSYERFLNENKWILKFWPNSVKIKGKEDRRIRQDSSLLSCFLVPLEKVCYWIQYNHMKPKITREVVTPTRALFHPQDWGKIILKRLAS